MDPALDQALFISDPQDSNKKLYFSTFFAYYFLKVDLYHFSQTKSHKKTQTVEIKGFLTMHFCLMMGGYGYL